MLESGEHKLEASLEEPKPPPKDDHKVIDGASTGVQASVLPEACDSSPSLQDGDTEEIALETEEDAGETGSRAVDQAKVVVQNESAVRDDSLDILQKPVEDNVPAGRDTQVDQAIINKSEDEFVPQYDISQEVTGAGGFGTVESTLVDQAGIDTDTVFPTVAPAVPSNARSYSEVLSTSSQTAKLQSGVVTLEKLHSGKPSGETAHLEKSLPSTHNSHTSWISNQANSFTTQIHLLLPELLHPQQHTVFARMLTLANRNIPLKHISGWYWTSDIFSLPIIQHPHWYKIAIYTTSGMRLPDTDHDRQVFGMANQVILFGFPFQHNMALPDLTERIIKILSLVRRGSSLSADLMFISDLLTINLNLNLVVNWDRVCGEFVSKIPKGTPSSLLRMCTVLGFCTKPLPKGFPSHNLLQVFGEPVTYSNDCLAPLSRAVISLTQHNIGNNHPSVWVYDLKYLVMFEEGIRWMNNFPFEHLKLADWDDLYALWKQIPPAHPKLGGFVAILLSMCTSVQTLLGFLGFFEDPQYILNQMKAEVTNKFTELLPNSIKLWTSLIGLEDNEIPDYWHTLLGPSGPFRNIVRSFIRQEILRLPNISPRADTSPENIAQLVIKYNLFDSTERAELMKNMVSKSEYWVTVTQHTLEIDAGLAADLVLVSQYFVKRSGKPSIWEVLLELQRIYAKIFHEDDGAFLRFAEHNTEVVVNKFSLQKLLSDATRVFSSTKLQPKTLSEVVTKVYGAIAGQRIIKETLTIPMIHEHIQTINGGKKNTTLNVTSWLMWSIIDSLLNCAAKIDIDFIGICDTHDFWKFILSANDTYGEKISTHSWILQAKDHIQQAASSLIGGTVTLPILQKIAAHKHRIEALGLVGPFDPNVLVDASDALTNYLKQSEYVTGFLNHYCRKADTVDIDKYLEDLCQQANEFSSLELKQLVAKNYFNKFQPVMAELRRFEQHKSTRTFNNLFMHYIETTLTTDAESNEGSDESGDSGDEIETKSLRVLQIAMAAPYINERYIEICKQYEQDISSIPLAEIDMLWSDIGQKSLNEEIVNISTGGMRKQNKVMLQSYVKSKYVIEHCRCLCEADDIFSLYDAEQRKIFEQHQNIADPITIGELHSWVLSVEEETPGYDDPHWGVLQELSEARDLLVFINEVLDVDIRKLIDSVEDHSDQYITEETVSSLVEVKRFFSSLLVEDEARSKQSVFVAHVKNDDKLALKIKNCATHVHGLRRIYKNIANREEVTKEIIQHAVVGGKYHFTESVVAMSYKDSPKSYSLTDLMDLRSRALLIVNSDKRLIFVQQEQHKETLANTQSEMNLFISQVDVVQAIYETIQELHLLGHFSFRTVSLTVERTEELPLEQALNTHQKQLLLCLASWKDLLQKARMDHYFLNYLHPQHLYVLHSYSNSKGEMSFSTVADILTYINPHFDAKLACTTLSYNGLGETEVPSEDLFSEDDYNYYDEEDDSTSGDDESLDDGYDSLIHNRNYETYLYAIGSKLDAIFSSVAPYSRQIIDPEVHPINEVRQRDIYVARLESKDVVVPAVMSLYSCLGKYPEPHQILFCNENTSWEEVNLLLLRCFYGFQGNINNVLYCIANIEYLNFDLQSKLVAAIVSLRKQVAESYRLALVICKGETQQHLLEQFHEFVHSPTLVQQQYLQRVFGAVQNEDSEVVVVTSQLPGLGKTEQIKSQAFRAHKTPVSFPVSGPITKARLVERLCALELDTDCECLHLTLNVLTDSFMVNTFLFELLVIGSISLGTSFYMRPKGKIFVEIANTLNNTLKDSLQMSMYFTTQHLHWNIDRLLVSYDVTTPIQVVCNYLFALYRKQLNTKDVSFFPPNQTAEVLPSTTCGSLLRHYFTKDEKDMSFTILNMFIEFFNNQLVKFTQSQFFTVESLTAMLGSTHDIRTILVNVLLQVSIDFAHRAAGASSQQRAYLISDANSNADTVVARFTQMIKWEDSNHLMLVFQSHNSQAITALYKDYTKVPDSVVQLMRSQHVGRGTFSLQNYNRMHTADLLGVLSKLARITGEAPQQLPSYALTVDNLLKMVLVLLRIRAHLPVLIMGETGCGKTSLIKFLSRVVGSEFLHMDFHAGITENNILEFMADVISKAYSTSETWWVFLDEINTCEHLGLVTELICNHSMLGASLPTNVVLIAACNPYKKRLRIQFTAGLEEKVKTDGQSALVYRVHPLPESLLDHVWDYGALEPTEERLYIQSIVANVQHSALFANLISASQDFMRSSEAPESVSMRDVKRCCKLAQFFGRNQIARETSKVQAKSNTSNRQKKRDKRKRKQKAKKKNNNNDNQNTNKDSQIDPSGNEVVEDEVEQLLAIVKQVPLTLAPIILALDICYHTRLSTTELRKQYRLTMAAIFSHHQHLISEEMFLSVIQWEQIGYLKPMELPDGTALNSALLENVFVMLVCILNKIPVFIVGKPGCSKSLSMQIINSNLRGPDSPNEFFRDKNQVFVIAFQGSESSTSEGIIKVFEKARKYHETNKDVIPVVLLDEVGLAEISKSNPLKVLHGLIEPAFPKEELDIAVVGISNWALDAAKMNRAVHLSRPDPDPEDLLSTSKAIQKAYKAEEVSEKTLQAVADAYYKYYQYQKNGKHKNFHGMRDFYALVKCIATNMEDAEEQRRLINSIERNFGGLPKELNTILEFFTREYNLQTTFSRTPVLELIKANTEDENARHLMVISNGDAALEILEQYLKSEDIPPVVIYGSEFSEDCSEQYSYRILSQIILCMEHGRRVILKNLGSIYGSLYDMLNQNYTYVGNKRSCRIALGPYSNPVCHVADGFRCIVLVEAKKIDFTDPPFLNRFEKQSFSYADVLDERGVAAVRSLTQWVTDITSGQDDFDATDMFLGYHEDTIASLVVQHSIADADRDILEACKRDMITIATADGIIRSASTFLAVHNSEEVGKWRDFFFENQLHQSLHDFTQFVYAQNSPAWGGFGDLLGLQTIVLTHSSIHTPIIPLVGAIASAEKILEIKVGTFTSEKQLNTCVQAFFSSYDQSLLVLQCDAANDAPHILLTKSIVNQVRAGWVNSGKIKHVLIVIHVHRGMDSDSWQFPFTSGWRMLSIDAIETPQVPLTKMLQRSAKELVNAEIFSLEGLIRSSIDWAFMCIKYPLCTSEQLQNIIALKTSIKESSKMVDLLKSKISPLLPDTAEIQSTIASRKRILLRFPTLLDALIDHVRASVAVPLAKLIFVVEKYCALWTYFNTNEEIQSAWLDLFEKITGVTTHIADPTGPECYNGPRGIYKLQFPFSLYFIQQLETYKTFFVDDKHRIEQIARNVDSTGSLTSQALTEQQDRMRQAVTALVIEYDSLFKKNLELFIGDFITIKFNSLGLLGENDTGKKKLKSFMEGKVPIAHPMDVLICWWRYEELLIVMMQLFHFTQARQLAADTENEIFNEETLAQSLCNALIPTPNRLFKFKSISVWQHHLNATLSKLPSLEMQLPPTVHILRICNDFVNFVLNPDTSVPKALLFELSTALLSAEVTNSQWVENLFAFIEKTKAEYPAVKLHLDQFICSFVLRAYTIAANYDSDDLETTLITILTYIAKDEKLSQGAGTIVTELCGRFFEDNSLLITLEQEDFKLAELRVLNNALIEARLYFKSQDNSFAALCGDCFTSILSSHDISISDLHSLELFETSIKLLKEIDAAPVLSVLSAAYIKVFGRSLVGLLELDDSNIMIPVGILTRINAQMNDKNPCVQSLIVFLLKILSETKSLLELQSLCRSKSHIFPWLGALEWSSEVPSPMPYDIFSTYNMYNEYETAFLTAVQRDNKGLLDDFITKCETTPEATRAMLAYMSNHAYFVNCSRSPSLPESKATEYVQSAVQKLPAITPAILVKLASNFNGMELLQLNPNLGAEQLHVAGVAVHLLNELATNPGILNTPFLQYLFLPTDLNTQFLLAGPEDVESMIRNAMGASRDGGHVRYRCSCGYIYFVGNCGRTNQTSTCPQCRQPVGGENHAIQPGHVKIDASPISQVQSACLPGLGQPEPTDVPLPLSHSVRRMTPTNYRILHFLTNLSLYMGVVLSFSPFATYKLPAPPEYFAAHVRNDWQALIDLLNLTDKGLCGVLHSIILYMAEHTSEFSTSSCLLSENARDNWEQQFNAYISAHILQNANNCEHELQSCIRQTRTTSVGVLELEIGELQSMSEEYKNKYLPRVFRVTSTPSFGTMRAHLLNNPNLAAKYPFMSLFFQCEKSLVLIKHLLPITEWSKIVIGKLSHRIDRKEARDMTIEDFIQKDPRVLQPAFEKFQTAWENIRDKVSRYQCHEIKEVPVITVKSPVVICCAKGKDEGIYLSGAIEYLVGLQNQFLQSVMDIAAAGCASVLYIKSDENEAALRACPVYELRSTDVINYEWSDAILKYAQPNLEHGHGKEIHYNFSKIEIELAFNLVSGKSMIDTNEIEEFEFHRELFHGLSTILQDVRAKIKQEKLPYLKVEAIKNDDTVGNNATKILAALEFVMTLAKTTGSRDENQTIGEYSKVWQLAASDVAVLKTGSLTDVPLRHLVALYEEVEDLLANKVNEYIDKAYTKKMTEKMKAEVGKIPLSQQLMVALRRFMFRFLSVEQLPANVPLSGFIPNLIMCWPQENPVDEEALSKQIPESICVAHAYDVFDHLRSKFEAPQVKQTSNETSKVQRIKKRQQFNNM